ncbi:MAG TPA: DUF1697 domain-containing protein [Nocardioides sp.]|uniref:DUF1697 domain-containing protein n=1 Tax=Nocardioides sp. TaxID=35761 RepID=UPI002F3E22F2
MPTYIAFLRAVNVGKRKFGKEAIVRACEAAGCTDVATYINTGNVRVTSPLRSRAKVEAALEKAFEAEAGFEVRTIAFTPAELIQVLADATELAGELPGAEAQYVSVLKEEPAADVVRRTEEAASAQDGEKLFVRGRAAHLLRKELAGYHSSRLGNDWVERRLGVATNRNLTVIRTLAERWGA